MRFLQLLFFLISTVVFSQNDIIAKEYFNNGEYEKALIEYKKLYNASPSNLIYINQIIYTHQELEQYNEAEIFLTQLIERVKYPAFIVELGYNFQLKGDLENAQINYEKALLSIDEKASNVYAVAKSFQAHSLLNEAITAYEKAMAINPNYNFNLQLSQIYGEQGNIEKMFNSYIDLIESNPTAIATVKRSITDFINDDSNNGNNVLFRKILLKKIQQQPNLAWNELLSWLFIQQKEFQKAFIQEKAIFNRDPQSLSRIEELALISTNENENAIAKDIFTYLIDTAQDIDTKLRAHNNLLQIEIKEASKDKYNIIKNKYVELLNTFENQPQTVNLQIAYAHFLAFYLNETKEASAFLENTLELPITELEKAKVKLELGDILVLQEKFNEALIYYTQIQRNLKNSTISQEARFKVAKTSYYKGDFKWAETQLKILKASTSQLIANDALDLKLLISDNKYEDSLQTALKLYAKADLLTFQNKNDEAVVLLDKILNQHKTEPIIAQALFKQAQLFGINLQFEKAKANYLAIIENYKDGILIDDACFHLAQIYEKHLNLPEEAKALYEQIIFNHADSIYFVDARKRYRALRGDAIN